MTSVGVAGSGGAAPGRESLGLSVVTPTYHRPRLAVEAVRSVLDQTLLPDEIIVVENGAGGEAGVAIRKLEPTPVPLRYVVEPKLGVSRARNRGAAEASGQLVAFLDDDSAASPEWLEALVDTYRSTPDVVAVGGRIALRWPCPRPGSVTGLEGFYGILDLGPEPREMRYPLYPYASNMLMGRAELLSLGGFPVELGRRGSSLLSSEEAGLFRRAAKQGRRVVYEPRALVHHLVHIDRLSRRWLVRRAFMQGRSDVVVETMFAGPCTPAERARHSARALGAAVDDWRLVRSSQSRPASIQRLVNLSTHLGTAFEELRLSLAPGRVGIGPGEGQPPQGC